MSARWAERPAPYAYAPATDTRELPRVYVGTPLEEAPTQLLHVVFDMPPAPIPQRLPKRLRRRVAAWLLAGAS